MLVVGVIIWAICFILSYGMLFSFVQHEFSSIAKVSYREDLGMAMGVSLFGPFSLFVIFLFSGFAKHGLKFY